MRDRTFGRTTWPSASTFTPQAFLSCRLHVTMCPFRQAIRRPRCITAPKEFLIFSLPCPTLHGSPCAKLLAREGFAASVYHVGCVRNGKQANLPPKDLTLPRSMSLQNSHRKRIP